jgi:hypothetical protein
MTLFTATLFKYQGQSAWFFVRVPPELAPRATKPWGRTPVLATVDGKSWETSVWKDKQHGSLLAVPKKIRGIKGEGDSVEVTLLARE